MGSSCRCSSWRSTPSSSVMHGWSGTVSSGPGLVLAVAMMAGYAAAPQVQVISTIFTSAARSNLSGVPGFPVPAPAGILSIGIWA